MKIPIEDLSAAGPVMLSAFDVNPPPSPGWSGQNTPPNSHTVLPPTLAYEDGAIWILYKGVSKSTPSNSAPTQAEQLINLKGLSILYIPKLIAKDQNTGKSILLDWRAVSPKGTVKGWDVYRRKVSPAAKAKLPTPAPPPGARLSNQAPQINNR
jgi:hypothetical protein